MDFEGSKLSANFVQIRPMGLPMFSPIGLIPIRSGLSTHCSVLESEHRSDDRRERDVEKLYPILMQNSHQRGSQPSISMKTHRAGRQN